MPRSIKMPNAGNTFPASYHPAQGGSGEETAVAARIYLKGFVEAEIGQPLGPLPENADGGIDSKFLDGLSFTQTGVDGDPTMMIGETKNFFLTTYDSYTDYVVEGVLGEAIINENVITFTAGNVPGVGGFTINDRLISITIQGTAVAPPSIESPLANATNVVFNPTFVASDFEVIGGTDTQESADWEISSTADFSNLIASSYGDTVNLTSWAPEDLSMKEYTKYYVRTRQKGAVHGNSEWSKTSSFTTKGDTIYELTSKFYGSDTAAGDCFGVSAAISKDGNYALIGAHNDSDNGSQTGAIYVFKYVSGAWVQQVKLYSPSPSVGECFGVAVALNEDASIAMIGGHGTHGTNGGCVYYFTRSGETWSNVQKITPPSNPIGDYFGASIAINGIGDYAVIGAFGDAINGFCSGAVYTFKKVNNSWQYEQKLYASDPAANNSFGNGIALNSDATIALISSPDVNSVYVFIHTGDVWTFQQKLYASDGRSGDKFGDGIALNAKGTIAFISSTYSDEKGVNAGTVYVFSRSGNTWTQLEKLYPSTSITEPVFGRGIAMSADGLRVIAGAYGDDDKGTNAGATYTFEMKSIPRYEEYGKLLASDGQSGDIFGRSVALSADGSYALIGASSDDDKGDYAGAVYVFTRSGNVWAQQQKFYAPDAITGDQFGVSVSLNADASYAMIGAVGVDDKGSGAGAVYVFIRSGTTWVFGQKIYAVDATPEDNFGISITLSSDALYALIGAHCDDDKGTDTGSVYVFTRSGSTWAQQQKLYASDASAFAYFGIATALNADASYALIGSYASNDKGSSAGAVYVFTRSGTTWTQQQKFYALTAQANDWFGFSIALNNDASLAIIGTHGSDDKGDLTGAVCVFSRTGDIWTQRQKLYSSDAQIGDLFGVSVALSADGSYALIGASSDDDKGIDAGSVYIFR